jgi:hypothetical protein
VEIVESLLVAKRIYLSYSDSSHVSINDLERALCGIDGVKVKRHDMGEITNYTPSQKASKNRDYVTEWLFEVRCVE